MSFEELRVAGGDLEHTHVNDFDTTNREEARRRLEFITAKLGASALETVSLGAEFDSLSRDDFELAA